MDIISLATQLGALIGCGFYFNYLNSGKFDVIASEITKIQKDVHEMKERMTSFEVTMARQDAEFRGVMAKQDAEYRGIMAKQDAEFKMFLRCGRLPLVRRGLKGSSD